MESGDSGREATRKVDSPTTDVWSEKNSRPPLVGLAPKKSGRELHATVTLNPNWLPSGRWWPDGDGFPQGVAGATTAVLCDGRAVYCTCSPDGQQSRAMWRTKLGWQQRIIWGSEGGEADGAEVATEGLWEVAPDLDYMGFCIQRVQHLWGPWLSRLGSVLPAGAWRVWVTSGASGSSIFGGGPALWLQ